MGIICAMILMLADKDLPPDGHRERITSVQNKSPLKSEFRLQ
jgi:hypothetical protein